MICQLYLNKKKTFGKPHGEDTIVRIYFEFFRCDENYSYPMNSGGDDTNMPSECLC